MKSVLVIGMGRFGRHLAEKLEELGNEVMVVDKSEDIINSISSLFTNALIGDCTQEAVLRKIGINNFDICFVTIADNFQASLEVTALLKDIGAKYVVSKASSEIQAKFLKRNGADEVVYPEKDMAEKTAIRHNANNIFDYIELTHEYGIFEIPVFAGWIGKSILELDVRKSYEINILAIKKDEDLSFLPTGDYVFEENDMMFVAGKTKEISRLTKNG